jgi:hypothetical protein
VADVTLNNFVQSGGVLTAGTMSVASYNQTGGNTSAIGDFTTSADFTQSGGTLSVGGITSITDTTGGTILGNINSTGPLNVVSTDGGIAQTSPSSINATGTSSFIATSGGASAAISLTNPNNHFGGAVSTNGSNVALTNGTGNLTLGRTIATGTLDVANTGGVIALVQPYTNTNQINVTGASSFTASTGSPAVPQNITFANPYNSFGGPLSVSGQNIAIVSGVGNLILNIITATGDLSITATGAPGNISQAPGSVVKVNGTSSVTSVNGIVSVVVQPLRVELLNNYSAAVVLNMIRNLESFGKPPVFVSAVYSQGVSGINRTLNSSSENIRVELVKSLAASNVGIVEVYIPAAGQAGFTFDLPVYIKQEVMSGVKPYALQMDGSALPSWLVFDSDNLRFTAGSLPAVALPIRVQLIIGKKRVVVEITKLSD